MTKEHSDDCRKLLKFMGIPYVDVCMSFFGYQRPLASRDLGLIPDLSIPPQLSLLGLSLDSSPLGPSVFLPLQHPPCYIIQFNQCVMQTLTSVNPEVVFGLMKLMFACLCCRHHVKQRLSVQNL